MNNIIILCDCSALSPGAFQAGDILLSTLIADLAPASKIEDTSWIEPGKAAWSWWSHPDDHSPKIYNEFTDLSASFGFKYDH
jgi:hypothetical protein